MLHCAVIIYLRPLSLIIKFPKLLLSLGTLQQNNTYMRQLSVTLLEWQEEVVRVQTTYKQKFEKAKELVIKVVLILNFFKIALTLINIYFPVKGRKC